MTTELKTVLQERGNRYGPFDGHAKITMDIKRVIEPYKDRLNDSQYEALHMIAHKIGRILNGDPNYADSWVDIAGYAQLIVKEIEDPPTIEDLSKAQHGKTYRMDLSEWIHQQHLEAMKDV